MKFKEISHSQSLETVDQWGLKHWYKSGVTVEIESQDEVDRAAKLAEQFVNEQLDKYKLGFSKVADNKTVPIVEVKKTPVESMVEAISGCSSMEVLLTFKKLAQSKPEFQQAFDETFKKLNNGL